MSAFIERLSQLIKEKGLEARIDDSRIQISPQYDIHYQIVTIGLVIRLFRGRKNKTVDRVKSINKTLLRLIHFLTLRPELINDFKHWHSIMQKNGTASLQDWASFPRGFFSDSAQVDTLTLLLIRKEIHENGKDILLDLSAKCEINRLTSYAVENDLFQRERGSIAELSALKLSIADLGF